MKKHGKGTVYWSSLALLAILVVGAVGACSSAVAAPGVSKALGSTAQGGYIFLRWQEGLEVMIWHDLTGESTANSAGVGTGPLYVEQGTAQAADGRSLAWEVQATDGTGGEAQIGGLRYDLAAGTLFLVTTAGGTVAVRQLSRDLSAVPLEHDGILTFAGNDLDLAAFLDENPTAALPSPTLTNAPAPTVTPTSSATPRPPVPTATPFPSTPTSPASPTVERIRFAPGATQATIEGHLPDGGRALYVMGVAAGQYVEIDATAGTTGQRLRFSITGADGVVVKPMGEAHVRTVVPGTQDYYVDLVSEVGATEYRLSVLIPVRIRFAPGATSATVTGGLEERQMRHYVLRAFAGQRMIVTTHTTVGQVGLVMSGADGQVLLSGRVGQPGGVYDGILPTSQDYLISVQAKGGIGADYTLGVTIPAEAGSGLALVGTVMDVSPSARTITLAEPVKGLAVIALTETCRLISAGGDEIELRELQAGMRIQAFGRPGASQALLADQVLVLSN